MNTPTPYTLESFQKIIDLIICGQSVAQAIKSSALISHEAFYRLCRDFEDLRAQYIDACRHRAFCMSEDLLDISEEMKKPSGLEHINACRVRVDIIKWTLCRMLPKLYGDKGVERDVQVVVVRDFSGKQPYDPSTDPDLKRE